MGFEKTHELRLEVLERSFAKSFCSISFLPEVKNFLLYKKLESRFWGRIGQEEKWGGKVVLNAEKADLDKPGGRVVWCRVEFVHSNFV